MTKVPDTNKVSNITYVTDFTNVTAITTGISDITNNTGMQCNQLQFCYFEILDIVHFDIVHLIQHI